MSDHVPHHISVSHFADYTTGHFQRVQVLLSDRFLGFFLTPEEGSWNFNDMATRYNQDLRYNFKLENPREFYHESHRPRHFLMFQSIESHAVDIKEDDVSADREDHFA